MYFQRHSPKLPGSQSGYVSVASSKLLFGEISLTPSTNFGGQLSFKPYHVNYGLRIGVWVIEYNPVTRHRQPLRSPSQVFAFERPRRLSPPLPI
ncbi:hypothetical protein GQ44DRAFT_718531 [Phaeosphaeriaceae sp. PMI808]|nr:hypothetical protein GQ44DRAFT_718531 [Phaeosphaeriaceae sp. PMI808]